jgi:sn1-specific diacylglycerol lipase
MPHLKFCNRYWYVAGDELSVPALCSISIRVFWTALITTVYACSYDQLKDCNLEWILQFYLLLSISLFLLSIVCDAIIINVSLKGTITTPEERKSIGSLLLYKFGLTAAEIVCGVFGLLTLVLGSILPCNQDVENSGWTKAFVAVVVASQLADGSIVWCCFFCLQTLEKDHEELKGIEENEAVALWEARCNSLRRCVAWGFCNLFGGNNVEEGFEKVARVLTTFFHHDGFLDVVASDVVAGFILVRVEQQHRKNTQQIVHTEQPFQQMSPLRQVRNNESDVLNLSDIEVQNRLKITRNLSVELERFSLEELDNWFRCSTFALAIYTHIMFLYMNPCSGWCRLSCRSCFHNPLCDLCLFRPRAKLQHKRYNKTSSFDNNVVIEGDNCCKLHYTGMKGLLDNLIDAELIHVSYKNNTIHKPFGIFLDHEKEWVVIALRGTLSLEDCVTDAYCDPVEVRSEIFHFEYFT